MMEVLSRCQTGEVLTQYKRRIDHKDEDGNVEGMLDKILVVGLTENGEVFCIYLSTVRSEGRFWVVK